jgi:hypothetical protein
MFDMNPAAVQQPVPIAYSPRALETQSTPKSSIPEAVKATAAVEKPQQQAARDDAKGTRGELVDVLA